MFFQWAFSQCETGLVVIHSSCHTVIIILLYVWIYSDNSTLTITSISLVVVPSPVLLPLPTQGNHYAEF